MDSVCFENHSDLHNAYFSLLLEEEAIALYIIKTVIHNGKCSQQRLVGGGGGDRQTPGNGIVRGGGGPKLVESPLVI